MVKDNISEVAWRQRFLVLLQKINNGDTLSPSEIKEVRKYERLSAKDKSISKSLIISEKPRTKKIIKKKTGHKRRSKIPISEGELKLLGLECDNLTEADATIQITKPLTDIFKEYPKLESAWKRGRLLRNLRDSARTGYSITAAATKVGLESGQQLRDLIDSDKEIGDLWQQTKLELDFEIRSAVIEAAKEGNAAALKAVDGLLSERKENTGFDVSRVTINQLSDLTGKHRKTIHDWISRGGLPRNPDKTFDLSIFISWYENYLLDRNRATRSNNHKGHGDLLRTMRAEKLSVEIEKHRNQLLDREEVIMGQIAWVQNILTFCKREGDELAKLCGGQPQHKIIELLKVFFSNLHSESAKVPDELKLPAAKKKQLVEFLLSLRPRGQRNDIE